MYVINIQANECPESGMNLFKYWLAFSNALMRHWWKNLCIPIELCRVASQLPIGCSKSTSTVRVQPLAW